MILNENRFLNEAFNNIPDWLKQYLVFQSKVYNYPASKKPHGTREVRYNVYGNRSTSKEITINGEKYNIVAGTFSSKKDNEFLGIENKYIGNLGFSHGLMNAFRSKGINVSNMIAYETDIPQKASDKRLKEPNIPIFLLYDGYGKWEDNKGICQVYAKGINDDELCTFSYEKLKNRLGTLPMKFLLEKCIAFAYVDGSEADNYISDDEIERRIARDKETPDRATYERLPKDFRKKYKDSLENGYSATYKGRRFLQGVGPNFSNGSYAYVDKSGYMHKISPANDSHWYSKFADIEKQKKYDKIKEKSLTNIDDIIDVYNQLTDDYKNILRYSSWLDSADKFNSSSNSTFKKVKEKIKELKDKIEDIKQYKEGPFSIPDSTLSTDAGLQSRLSDCNDLIKQIKSYLNKYTLNNNSEYADYAELDWD